MDAYEKIACLVFAIFFLAGMIQKVQATEYSVSALTDIWLASQPNGASVSGYFGTDYVPGNCLFWYLSPLATF